MALPMTLRQQKGLFLGFLILIVMVEIVQHTAEIRVGNSGGPLVNSCGMVVGVNTFLRIVSESAGEKDNLQSAAQSWIKVIGQRVLRLKILDSCQELSGIPAAAGDVESIPPLRDDQASSTSNFSIDQSSDLIWETTCQFSSLLGCYSI